MKYDETAGDGLRVGIVDSVEKPTLPFEGNVSFTHDFRADSDQSVTEAHPRHGDLVADVVHSVIPNATFEFYRVIPTESDQPDTGGETTGRHSGKGETELAPDALQRAIDTAAERGVDVLNLSVGVDGTNSTAGARLAASAARATDDGVVIVAASGNNTKVQRLCYPAGAPASISVGGTVEQCRYRRYSSVNGDERIWVNRLSETRAKQGPFCGETGCTASIDECDERRTKWWNGNVEPRGVNPHTAAPCHHVVTYPSDPESDESDDTVGLVVGTSFAAPLVTGLVGRLICEYGDVAAGHLTKAFARTGRFIGYDPTRDFYRTAVDARSLRDEIQSKY